MRPIKSTYLLKSLRIVFAFSLSLFITNQTLANHNESVSDESKSDEKSESTRLNKAWTYIGAFQLNKVLTLEDLTFGGFYKGRFYEDLYNVSNSLDVKILKAPTQYYSSSDPYSRYNYDFTMSTDPFWNGATVYTSIDLMRERWGKNQGINYGTRIAAIAFDYTYKFNSFFQDIGLGYAPIYEYQNYNVVTSTDTLLYTKSAEYLHHAIKFHFSLKFGNDTELIEELQYTRAKDIKLGGTTRDNDEVSNHLKFFYYIGHDFHLYYKNDYVSQNRRNLKFGLTKSYMEHSFNLAYSF